VDGDTGAEDGFEYVDGIRAHVDRLDADCHPLHPDVIVARGEGEGVRHEVGLRWCQEEYQPWLSYANGEPTTDGGTHQTGLRTAVTRSLNEFVRDHLPGVRHLKGDEVRDGLTAVVSVWLADPLFEGSTRTRLSNPEARRAVESGVGGFLRDYFRANPQVAERVVRAALARPGGPMTETEWLARSDPRPMLRFVSGTGSQRRARLFVAGCCRLDPSGSGRRHNRELLRTAERLADRPTAGGGTPRARARRAPAQHGVGAPDFGPRDAARLAAGLSSGGEDERTEQAGLVRCVFGNPFRPATADPSWLTSTVVSLAEGIYADRAFDRLPIPADALQDAGCANDDVLDHCRGPGPHVRGCWVVDLVLGKG
jgi:hypothetical protein